MKYVRGFYFTQTVRLCALFSKNNVGFSDFCIFKQFVLAVVRRWILTTWYSDEKVFLSSVNEVCILCIDLLLMRGSHVSFIDMSDELL